MITARPAALDLANRAHRDEALAAKAAGLAFVAVFSGLVWMAITAAGAQLFGLALSAKALIAVGSAVAAFLSTICAPLMLRV